MKYRAALLDLDDTTLDRKEALCCFIERFIADFSNAIDPAFRSKLKPMFIEIDNRGYKPRDEMFLEIHEKFEWTAKPELQTIKDYWFTEMPRCALPMPGLDETLDFLREKGLLIGIVTNGPSWMQNIKIDILGLRPRVDAIIISGEAGFRKPDIRIFQLALSTLAAQSSEAFFVGDNPEADIAGALNAGLTAVWMSGGEDWNTSEYRPNHIITGLPDIMNIL